jgi:acyl CoA:acetate/3-ketoacid CoA transferase beta subunit
VTQVALRRGPPTRAEVCAAAIADAFRGDGEILANPIGTLPVIGGRLAKATFAPELVMTDGEALLVENILPVGVDNPEKVVAGWNPYRSMFDVVWSGRRHVIMGASQIDKFGNQNFAFIGSHDKPKAQLLGMRGAPGNTINDKTSYWIPSHTTRTFVPAVDVVSGVGYDRARDLGAKAAGAQVVHFLLQVGGGAAENLPDPLRAVARGIDHQQQIAGVQIFNGLFQLYIRDTVSQNRF